MTRTAREIFKAYDIRGLYGEQIDGDVAEQIGRAFARVLAGPRRQARRASCASASAATCASPRPSSPRATATGMLRRGRARARRRAGRHRDALLPRRLARARRRADVHRLAQPEGLHGREAGRARARSRCRATRASRTSAGWSQDGPAGDRARRRLRRRRSTSARSSSRRALAFIDPVERQAPMKVVVDGGNGMAGTMVGPLLDRLGARPRQDLLDAGRQLPRPRAQPAARGEPALHRRQGPLGGRRPRHRLGRRRRPLLLHRRHRPVRRRRLPHRAARRAPAGQAAGRATSSTTSAPRARCPTRSRARGRHAAHQPRRPRVLQDAHARRGRDLRRRGLRPLLLPRLLQRRLGHDPRAAHPREALRARARR